MNAVLLALVWMTTGFTVAVVFGHMCTTEHDTGSTKHPELDVTIVARPSKIGYGEASTTIPPRWMKPIPIWTKR